MRFSFDIYLGMAAWMSVFGVMLYRSIKHPEENDEEED